MKLKPKFGTIGDAFKNAGRCKEVGYKKCRKCPVRRKCPSLTAQKGRV